VIQWGDGESVAEAATESVVLRYALARSEIAERPGAARSMVLALADSFRTGSFDESVFHLIEPNFASG
jgi:hypothetical protein